MTPEERREYHTVVLGALLHDIGKFYERSASLPAWAEGYRREARYGHEAFGAAFVDRFAKPWTDDPHTLRRLVLNHHDPDLPDERLVQLADWLSAYERAEAKDEGEEGARGRAESALRTVLSRVELEGRRAESPLYYELVPLGFDRDTLMPKPEARASPQVYRALWEAFTEDVRRVERGDFPTLLAVLRKYTWAVPSDTRRQTVPDISLYEHLKATAAIAACLVRETLSEGELKTLSSALAKLFGSDEALSPSEEQLLECPIAALVKGDISGTQDFLYLLTSSGAARGLRGRSFYLQLLTETIAHWTLRRFELPATNLLFASGGHFYLLLPYGETEERLDDLRGQIARRLWKAHRGDLVLNVDAVPVTARDFCSAFPEKWEAVSRRVNERKQRKWAELGEEMMTALFTARQKGTTAEEMCQVCHGEWRAGVDRLDEEVRKCRRCYQFEELGRLLRDPTHLVLFTVPEAEPPDPWDWRGVLRAFGTRPWLVRKGEAVPEAEARGATAATVYTFDSTDFLNDFRRDGLPTSYDFRLLADATPIKGYDEEGKPVIAEFGDLAEAAEGVPWLGVLRMDVDSLGEVFRRGLGEHATISRMSTLSESLRLFFEGWVPQLCQQHNRFREGNRDRLYLIYAGGDDLFVVGAWSALPELVQQIRDDFRRFVGGDHVTLSGGIAIEHAKYPLYQLAQDAKGALEDRAKEFKHPDGREKDALCFLQTAMGWERFAEVTAWKDELMRMLEPKDNRTALPRGFLTRLMEIHALYEDNARRQHRLKRTGASVHSIEEMIAYDKWRWRLTYQLGRFGERYQHHREKIDELRQAIVRDADGLISVLHVLARWTALLMREEG